MAQVKVTSLRDANPRALNDEKGLTYSIIGQEDGAVQVDLHLNVVNPRTRAFPLHYHDKNENVYIILKGTAELRLDDGTRRLGEGGVVFIPPGTPHALGNPGDVELVALELYSPADADFHRLE